MNNKVNFVPVKTALISVSDKDGIVELARELSAHGVRLISTGGTAKTLRDAGLSVEDVSEVTGFPEMLDGRVKTLHPKIHGGLLGLRESEAHRATMNAHDIAPIDLVVVNLYPFERTIANPQTTTEEAVEQIDIGGPSMIRSASKNYQSVCVLTDSKFYEEFLAEFKRSDGQTSLEFRHKCAVQAFQRTGEYDAAIAQYLAGATEKTADVTPFSDRRVLNLTKKRDLRYGENPHQKAALYTAGANGGIAGAVLLGGKEMSYNNYLDADAAWQLICDFDELACAIIKHTNPCGVGTGESVLEAYKRALATDPTSAFGGIVAVNKPIDLDAAKAIAEIFTEVIVAPDYTPDALELLQTKKNLRLMRVEKETCDAEPIDYNPISGGLLAQTYDREVLNIEEAKIVSDRLPTEQEMKALHLAWRVCKHVKSNAIVYANENQTVGVGAGQMSRVDSVKIGAMRAQIEVKGTVIASDAFFPFRDGIDEAAKHGITAVIQPGGSMRDAEVIQAANEHNLAMIVTGVRHFKH